MRWRTAHKRRRKLRAPKVFRIGILDGITLGIMAGTYDHLEAEALEAIRSQIEAWRYANHIKELRALAVRYYEPRRNR